MLPAERHLFEFFENVFSGLVGPQKVRKKAQQVANDLLGADVFQYDYNLHCIVHMYGRTDPEGELCFF